MENEEKEASAMPDTRDDELWQELNRRLWLLVKEAEPAKFGEDQLSDLRGVQTVPIRDSRKKECLSFARCEEVTETPASLTVGEKAHLENCGYCERRLNAYSELLPLQTQEAPTSTIVHPTPEVKSARVGVLEQISAFFSRPLVAALSVASLILVASLIGFLVFRNSSGWPGLRRPEIQPSTANNKKEESLVSPPHPTDPTAKVTGPDKQPIVSTTNVDKPKHDGESDETKKSKRDKEVESSASLTDLRGIPEAYHEFVQSVLKSSTLRVADDLEKWLRPLGRVRAGAEEPELLSPNRQAITENQPTFRWKANPKDASFKIILLDRQKKRLREEQLTRNSWVIPFALPAGIYYWEIHVFDKDGNVIAKTKMEAVFKIVDKAEVERVKSENGSHLAKASYFITVGLLDDAEIELEAELVKNPRSRKTQSILRQVRRWQRQLR